MNRAAFGGEAARPAESDAPPSRPVLYHGTRLLLVLGVAVLVTILFPPVTERESVGRYEVGMVAPEDIIAQVPFSVPKTPLELSRDRGVAMESVPPTYDFEPAAADTMAAHLGRFFGRVDSAAEAGDRARVEAILRQASLVASPSQVDLLMDDQGRGVLRRAALLATNQILSQGVVDAVEFQDLTTATVTIHDQEGGERSVSADEMVTSRRFFDAADGLLPSARAPDMSELLRILLIRYIEYSYVLNVVATEGDRDAARSSVTTTKDDVLEGQAIVRSADPIGTTELEMLNAYQEELRSRGLLEEQRFQVGPLAGSVILNFMLMGIFGLLVYLFRPEVYQNLRALMLVAILTSVYFVAASAIAANGLPPEWLPIAFVGLPVGVLWDARMALVLVMIIAVQTGTLAPFTDYGNVLSVLAGGAAAAMSARAVRRRSQTWVSIAIIAGATGVVLLGHGLATGHDMSGVTRSMLPVAGNATVSALLAIGFLWVFELFTGITTDQTLLEWADPMRPLLKRLSFEAPGTYAHSINVANLAEAGANAIGANGLLCRVGVYYHDVGKVLKPHYFVENQPDGRNPHDKLKPETSASIVREHVTEGARLARDAGVPDVVIQFIQEHHGTQKIGFFYEKALEEADGSPVDTAKFSYPGPKPQSRETAIVMLADSCESATKAMKDPTPERIRDLIDTVVEGKIAQGQFSETPLTLKDIDQVKEQFVNILTGVLHRRIDYPATKHLTESKGGVGPSTASSSGRTPARTPGTPARVSGAAYTTPSSEEATEPTVGSSADTLGTPVGRPDVTDHHPDGDDGPDRSGDDRDGADAPEVDSRTPGARRDSSASTDPERDGREG